MYAAPFPCPSQHSQADSVTAKSTVMLNANVAFMSIPSIVNNNNNTNGPSHTRSPQVVQTTPAQLASCLSVMASIGSIILGLLLIRENRSKGREEAAEAVRSVCFRSVSWSTRVR